MRKIFLHLGYPKTGTSSIQAFHRDNSEVLAKLGFHVPSVGRGPHGAHHTLIRTLAGQPVPPHAAVTESDIIRELSEAPADCVLISSELLTGMLVNPGQAGRLLGSLRSTGAEIVLVMYVRNQSQRLNSGYSQQVKSFRHRGQFRAHIANALANRAAYGYAQWFDIVGRHGLELRARPFSEEVRKEGVIHDYLRTVGCPSSDQLSLPPRANESVGPFTVEAARRLQTWAVERWDGLTLLQANRCKVTLDQTIRATDIREPRYCGLDDELARKIDAAFAASNVGFARRTWGCDWQSVFHSDIAQSFETNDYLDTGVPPPVREPLQAVLAKMRSEIEMILKRPRLAVREDWNKLPG